MSPLDMANAKIFALDPLKPGLTKVSTFFGTIRGRILIAFLLMSLVTGIVGTYAVIGLKRAAELVSKTFDGSLMSINYARAAAADFAGMRAALARRWIESDPITQAQLDQTVKSLEKSLVDDLAVAAERSQSVRASQAAESVRGAVAEWNGVRARLLGGTDPEITWTSLDYQSVVVDQQIDLLVNYTAGEGFLYRQTAREAVTHDIQLNIAVTLLALAFSAAIAWLLARRIIGPVALASEVAERIAEGKLEVQIPRGSADELGSLLSSMRRMRNNISAMMQREVEQRRSAQTRLADALESSSEGVIVVDAQGCLALANSQAAAFLGLASESLGSPVSELGLLKVRSRDQVAGQSLDALPPRGETLLSDGRWVRVSKNTTCDGGFIVVCSDITVLKEHEAMLQGINLRLDAALDNMSQGLCLFDADDNLQVVNRRFCEIFRLPREGVKLGTTFKEIFDLSLATGNHRSAAAPEILSEHLELGPHPRGTHFLDLSDGRIVACVYNRMSNGGWVVTYEDVTERRQAEEKIIHMVRHDALTNLPNRVYFREQMETALERVDRDVNLAVLYLDLDRFKSVNDTLGHPIGDELLCAVTRRLQSVVRGSDTVARLSGDEFAILQVDADQPVSARTLAARVLDEIAEPFELNGHQIIIGTSIGIAIAPTDGNQPDQLLRNADMALYRAKADGRGTYHFFQPEMDAQMQARRALEIDLRKALLACEFELYYQPIVNLATGDVSGFEALIRWHHPTRGMVSPTEFVPLAEEIGLIVPLGEWVLREACKEATRWDHELRVSVNLSPAQFRSGALVLSVVSALGGAGLSASRLELEITETVLLRNTAIVLEALHQIRELGVHISMDDFGTGYSSLSYLRSFPFDRIKIDRSFVWELGQKRDSIEIIRAITNLSKSLGMTTTAEGVETEEQLEILRAEGCTHAQGYLFSRPKPATDIYSMLQDVGSRGAGPDAGGILLIPERRSAKTA